MQRTLIFLASLLVLLSVSHSFSPPSALTPSHHWFRLRMTECALKQSSTNDDKQQKCVPCESLDTSALLTREQVQESIQETISLWTIQETPNQTMYLSRTFIAKNFQAALDCINAIGVIAEREGHHPDLHLTNYRHVEICLYTHSLSGITRNDVNMCAMLDREVSIVYSPKWLKEHPEVLSNNNKC